MEVKMIDFEKVLDEGIANDASDIHIIWL